MEEIGFHALNGISYGMLLFLIASGLSLIFGLMGVLNFAHGSLYLIGAYIGLELANHVSNFWLIAIVSGLVAGVVGLFIQRVFFARFHGQFNEQVLLSIGLIYIFENLFQWIWGPLTKTGTVPSYLAFSIDIGELSFPVYRLFITFLGLVVFAGLWWFQEKTRAGAIVRAGMDDEEMTVGLGINYALVCSAVFFLGTFVGGVAGFIAAPWLGAEPRAGFPILILAIIVIIIGGVGTVQGTLVGAIVVGLIDSFGKAFIPQFALFTPYLAFIVILLARPSGLLGRK